MRQPRIKGDGPVCYYHVTSRVIERRFVFGVGERERFRKLMRQQEAFCGVRVLTWACLSNHFHLLLAVEEREAAAPGRLLRRLLEDDEAFLAHLRHVYDGSRVVEVRKLLAGIRKRAASEAAVARAVAEFKQPYFDRMFDLSVFVGELKQRMTQWFNGRNERKGTLWEERFGSVLVQGAPGVLAIVAAYIDLNAVRAGLVDDPKAWRWCGYAEAVAAPGEARWGIHEVLGEPARPGVEGVPGKAVPWKRLHRRYREVLMASAAGGRQESGNLADEGKASVGLGDGEGGGHELPALGILCHRVRYFTEGLALGTAAFVEGVFSRQRRAMGVKREQGARKAKGVELGALRVLKDLRRL